MKSGILPESAVFSEAVFSRLSEGETGTRPWRTVH